MFVLIVVVVSLLCQAAAASVALRISAGLGLAASCACYGFNGGSESQRSGRNLPGNSSGPHFRIGGITDFSDMPRRRLAHRAGS